MTDPKRIQLRRTKGWRKPEGAIVVARPSKWGNPFAIAEHGRDGSVSAFRQMLARTSSARHGWLTRGGYCHTFTTYPSDEEIRTELAGHDLACWCPLDQPCHADVLLDLANPGDTVTATDRAAEIMASAYDAALDVESWDLHRVWTETLAAIPADLLARVVAERADSPPEDPDGD